jgi:CubicO group peptidase (beta-lactamase class C family)
MNRKSLGFLLTAALLLVYGTGSNRLAGSSENGSMGNWMGLSACGVDTGQACRKKMHERLDSLFTYKARFEGFNGNVLIVYEGTPVYKGCFGFSDIRQGEVLMPNTSFQLASVSKTFTATAVLKLVEKGAVRLQDSISRFFPNFPYRGITVEHLLSHRSGLPNYLVFGERYWKDRRKLMSNDDVLEMMCIWKPQIEFRPGAIFRYCNTNYVLLALLVEKVSGQCFHSFMEKEFFGPLGMQNSFVFDKDYTRHNEAAVSYDYRWKDTGFTPYDGVSGDKGIYSTIEDMYKWDLGLKQGRILSDSMMRQAYTPFSRDSRNQKFYGLGWRLSRMEDGSYLPYHNGWWHGNNTVFWRNVRDNSSIIILGNKYNRGIYHIDPVWKILYNTNTQESIEDSE